RAGPLAQAPAPPEARPGRVDSLVAHARRGALHASLSGAAAPAPLLARSHLKPQSGAAGPIAQRLHSSVIAVAAAVEDGLRDPLGLRALAERGPDRLRPLGLAALRVLDVAARRGDERLPGLVVDELRVDVRERADHGEPRARRAAADVIAYALVTPGTALASGLFGHSLGLRRADLAGLARFAADVL